MRVTKIIVSSLLLLSFISWVYAAWEMTGEGLTNIPQVNNLWIWSSTVNVDFTTPKTNNTNTTSTTTWDTVVKNTTVPSVSVENADMKYPFCNINSTAGLSDKYFVWKVSQREEKYIILTYLWTYWKWYMDKINKDKTHDKKLTRYDVLESDSLRDGALKDCYAFRNKEPENHDIINNLYKQVHFYSTYYSNYPDRLTEWITPGFLIFAIDLVDSLSSYLMLFTTLNIVIWAVLYMVWPMDKKEDFWKRVVNWFWYLLIVWTIKLGVLWSVIAFIGYEGLDFLKIFLF